MEKKHISKRLGRKEGAEQQREAVRHLLGWTEEAMSWFVYNQGLRYLKVYLLNNHQDIRILETSKIFWAWWKNHWANRDRDFLLLQKHHPVRDREIREQLYQHYNDGKMLADSIHPNSVVLHETYAVMVTELVKTETDKQHEKLIN